MQLAAWRRVAADEGLHFPPAAQARRAMFDVRPERAVTEVGGWVGLVVWVWGHLSPVCPAERATHSRPFAPLVL